MANRSSSAHFLLIAIAALLLLALSAAADESIATLLKIPETSPFHKKLARDMLELTISPHAVLTLSQKDGSVLAAIRRVGAQIENIKVEDSELVWRKPNLLVLRTSARFYMLKLAKHALGLYSSISVAEVDGSHYGTEAGEIVKLLLPKEHGNPELFKALEKHLANAKGKLSNWEDKESLELFRHKNEVYAAYSTVKKWWYKVVMPAHTTLIDNQYTIRLDSPSFYVGEDPDVQRADVTFEGKEDYWTFSAVFVGPAAIKRRVAETLFFGDTLKMRELFANAIGTTRALFSTHYSFQIRLGTNSKEYVHVKLWDGERHTHVTAQGELRRLSLDLVSGVAQFHLKQDGGKASFLLGCSRAEDLWTCPTLKNWSKQIVEAAFYNDALKAAFKLDDFGEGFPANDDGSISKVFGESLNAVLIEAKPSTTGYNISATCLNLPSGRPDGAVSMSVTTIERGGLRANWFAIISPVPRIEKRWLALYVKTKGAPKSRRITIDRDADGAVWTVCLP
eukprot:GHVS01073954.1.p1 GENE.GHVS01073954.1~~GHVS01073954.1.p1  ORF type:complete len:508 (+),score=31.27 GHVS01073954.1:95-1618(+)